MLAVDASSIGKQVRCPKCQTSLIVRPASSSQTSPGARKVVPSDESVSSQTSRIAATDSKVVSCQNCNTKMSVKLLDTPAVVACPNCKGKMQLPARPTPARPATTALSRPTTPVLSPSSSPDVPGKPQSPTHLDSLSHATPPEISSVGADFGQLDLPSAPPSSGGGSFREKPVSTVPSSLGFGNQLLGWVNGHRFVTAILFVNVAMLLGGVFDSRAWMLSLVEVPIGAVIAGALFLPRMHLVDRVSRTIGGGVARVAGFGASGLLVVILLVGAKVALRMTGRINRNDNLDFSGFTPSTVGAMLGSFAVFIALAAVFFFLWKLVGFVRLCATGYLFQSLLLVLSVAITSAEISRREEAIERRHQEHLDQMKLAENRRVPRFGGQGNGSRRFGEAAEQNSFGISTQEKRLRPMERSEIRIIFMHRPDAEIEAVRDAFLKRAGSPECETVNQYPTQTHFILQDGRDPSELAELIDFGRVVSTSKLARAITVVPRIPSRDN